MNKIGKPLAIIGGIILLFSFNMDVSVESGYGRVNNLGLMADRSNYLLLGALALIAGLILASKDKFTNKIEVTAGTEEKTCPYCAETIKKDAKLCKHCKKDLTLPTADQDEQDLQKSSTDINLEKPKQKSKTEPLDRSTLNKTLTEEFSTRKSISEIRSIIADEILKYEKKLDRRKLIHSSSGTVLIECTAKKTQENRASITISYQEESLMLRIFLLGFGLVFAAAKDMPIMFWIFLIAFVTWLIFKNKLTTGKAKKALHAIRSRVEA